MIFQQLFDPQSSIYTHLRGHRHNGQAVLVDPVLEQMRPRCGTIDELTLGLLAILELMFMPITAPPTGNISVGTPRARPVQPRPSSRGQRTVSSND